MNGRSAESPLGAVGAAGVWRCATCEFLGDGVGVAVGAAGAHQSTSAGSRLDAARPMRYDAVSAKAGTMNPGCSP